MTVQTLAAVRPHCHSRRVANAAPCASDSSFAQAIWGCTRPPRPQSVEAMTRSFPTRLAELAVPRNGDAQVLLAAHDVRDARAELRLESTLVARLA